VLDQERLFTVIRELRLSNADSVLLMPSHVRVLSDVVVGSQHVGRLRASELCDVEVHTALCPSVCLSVCHTVDRQRPADA